MDELLAQARRLAEMIAQHPRTLAFHEAIAAVEADPEAQKAQRAYSTAVEEVHRREAEGRPVEPDHKRAINAAAEGVRRSPVLVRLLKAQAEYAEMLDSVQAILAGGEEEEPHEHGPGCAHHHEAEPTAPKGEAEPPAGQGRVLWTP
jgi:cell fate (sporulation/competence/biofilm development) regulator YlbF (YheA/YmcA/DUF963 family)